MLFGGAETCGLGASAAVRLASTKYVLRMADACTSPSRRLLPAFFCSNRNRPRAVELVQRRLLKTTLLAGEAIGAQSSPMADNEPVCLPNLPGSSKKAL